jgi:hypothetical protein
MVRQIVMATKAGGGASCSLMVAMKQRETGMDQAPGIRTFNSMISVTYFLQIGTTSESFD